MSITRNRFGGQTMEVCNAQTREGARAALLIINTEKVGGKTP